MRPTCGCGFEMWPLATTALAIFMCRRCDTTAQPGGQRVGPPNAPGTSNGWFNAPFGDRK